MEKILVPIVLGEKEIWSVIHGLQLARRVNGSVTVLEIDVSDSMRQSKTSALLRRQDAIRQYWAEQAEKKEVEYEYVRVKGSFCEEIRRLCHCTSFSTVVLEMSTSGKNTTPTKMLKMIHTLQSDQTCRIELLMNSRTSHL